MSTGFLEEFPLYQWFPELIAPAASRQVKLSIAKLRATCYSGLRHASNGRE